VLEWSIDQYEVGEEKLGGIMNDPNNPKDKEIYYAPGRESNHSRYGDSTAYQRAGTGGHARGLDELASSSSTLKASPGPYSQRF